MTRSSVHIALGANLGDRLATLRSAKDALGRLGALRACSSIWETEPHGPPPAYLNAVVELATSATPEALLDALLAIEAAHGRQRTGQPNAPRSLDLDLLLWQERQISVERLVIPHPRLAERRFVLAPLVEIAATLRHPILGRTIAELDAALVSRGNGSGGWVRRLDVAW